jgi:eukaryotic-like serine/threonine-protein kinase
MALAVGTRLNHYEVRGPLGAGGMGEVYRALDTRLDRAVAIKVLPADFAKDVDRLRRFEQEARATSALNHPNILTVYDIGHHEGSPYFVAELLEGEELRAQLNDGPLPVRRAVEYAQQIAAGLAAAHERGVVHRDLKPENLFITKEGRVKILDFGLAKLKPKTMGGGVDSEAPTMKPLTNPGVVMGTVGYMSPEQVRGAEVDHRSDIFSFGMILYEMLSGKRAFDGASMAELMSAILKEEPPELSETNAKISPALDKLVRRCLEKKPERRFQSTNDLGFALESLATPSGTHGNTVALPVVAEAQDKARAARWRSAQWLGWAVAGVLLLGLLAGALAWLQRAPGELRAIRSAIVIPEEMNFRRDFALSPDGRHLALVARTGGKIQIWVRSLDTPAVRALAGTDGASFIFWSPDSRSIGFFAAGKLKRIEATGGPTTNICDVGNGRGATWNRDGVIVFPPTEGSELHRVSAAGGQATAVTKIDEKAAERYQRFPSFLPDGNHFLYVSQGMIRVAALDSPVGKPLVPADSHAVYAQGHVLFVRGGLLLAQPFDLKRLATTGEAVPLAEQVGISRAGKGAFAASEQGLLVYGTGAPEGGQLTWFDRSGKQTGVLGDTANYPALNLSPDGKNVAVQIVDSQGAEDLWLYEVARGMRTRFTADGKGNREAVWSPDSRHLIFNSSRNGPRDLYQKTVDGAGEELLLATDLEKVPTAWSPDGRFLLYYSMADPRTKSDVWVLPMAGERQPLPFSQTEFAERRGQFSPDGRWIVYTSDESGQEEVYVAAFPGPGGKRRISTAGGLIPRWRGNEIFYIAADYKLMAAEVRTQGAAIEIGAARALFETRPWLLTAGYQYDVTADGQRFLINWAGERSATAPLTLVQNWAEGLKK